MSNRSKVGKDFIKKDKETAELRIKAEKKAENKKMSPPSKKELVDDARNSIQDREKRKKLFASHDIVQSINEKLGKPISYYSRNLDKKSRKAQIRGRKKLVKAVDKEATAKQVPKSMNMGGVLKNRGGMFKGTY
tara:strand:+ start:150 stop:551 length:402 start_codon:yes stop_codon:yes gene_type:complete